MNDCENYDEFSPRCVQCSQGLRWALNDTPEEQEDIEDELLEFLSEYLQEGRQTEVLIALMNVSGTLTKGPVVAS